MAMRGGMTRGPTGLGKRTLGRMMGTETSASMFWVGAAGAGSGGEMVRSMTSPTASILKMKLNAEISELNFNLSITTKYSDLKTFSQI